MAWQSSAWLPQVAPCPALGPRQKQCRGAHHRHRRCVTRPESTDWAAVSQHVLPAILQLSVRVEDAWLRWGSTAPPGLALTQAPPPSERFRLVEGGVDETRIRIQNVFYTSSLFRKCHLEVAAGAKGLSVLHCVMFPWAAHDLPLFSLDMVAFGPRVTLAIVDVCPSRDDLTLPSAYDAVTALSSLTAGLQLRGIPEWGTRIFSKHCVCVSPRDADDVHAFAAFALALLEVHLAAALGAYAAQPRAPQAVAATAAAHARFCEYQLRNDKTRRILAAAIDEGFAEQYMKEVLFDAQPADAVPWLPAQTVVM